MRLDGFGRFATVAEIDSTGRWVGRFEDGNYVVLGQPSPIGPLAERESGYFCAWPLKPR